MSVSLSELFEDMEMDQKEIRIIQQPSHTLHSGSFILKDEPSSGKLHLSFLLQVTRIY